MSSGSGRQVAIIETGVANIASVRAALTRLGASHEGVQTPEAIATAEHLVLPGVGAFGAGMSRLVELGIAEAIRERVAAGRPTLAICLGLQLLCRGSDESPGVEGLGIIPAHVGRFGDHVRVPQLGWNRIKPSAGCRLLTEGYVYFANSYRLDALPEGWEGAVADHGGEFVAAVERGDVLACQFHPELSGSFGAALLERWLAT